MAKTPTPKPPKLVTTLRHADDKRKNIPTAEYQSVSKPEDQTPITVAYERCDRDLDPQLVWRGKDPRDWSELVVIRRLPTCTTGAQDGGGVFGSRT